jgi:hypothetical protein
MTIEGGQARRMNAKLASDAWRALGGVADAAKKDMNSARP